jgi:signal transduction histidine kinase
MDTIAYHRASHGDIHHRKLKFDRKIGGQWYHIETYNSLLEPEDTLFGTLVSFAVITVLLIVLSLVIGMIVSKWLLKPFHNSLSEIQIFNIQNRRPIRLTNTNTIEFKTLNNFIYEMTNRAIRDYNNLREFSENAAHEIRTPMAIASGKLDLLLQSNQLSEEQLSLISDAQKSIKGLSKVQHSLNLLSRLENENQFKFQKINLSKLVLRITNDHSEITVLKDLKYDVELDNNVIINADESLLEILISNLIQNAIRHNVVGGFVNVNLTSHQLTISNSGHELISEPSDMFKRFKRSNLKGNESLGLGLSIVKKITEKNGFAIAYTFEKENNIHTLTLNF